MPTKEKQELECAKCGELNPPGKNTCVKCGARMYISCHHCGHSNVRATSHCTECGHRLHRSLWRKLRKRIFGRRPKVTPMQILLLIVFVVVAYKVVIYLSEYQPPSYQGE